MNLTEGENVTVMKTMLSANIRIEDRLLALFLGLRYRHVTLKRVRAVLACGCLALLLIMLVWYFHAKTVRIIMIILLDTLSHYLAVLVHEDRP